MKQVRLSGWFRNHLIAVLVVTILSILSLGIIRALAHAQEASRACFCVGSLRFLSSACITYIDDHGGGRFFPTSLEDLWRVYPGITDRSWCFSDESPSKSAEGFNLSYTSAFDLAWKNRKLIPKRTPSNIIMIWETRSVHHNKGDRKVAYFDAHVETLSREGFRNELHTLQKVLDALPAEGTPAPDAEGGGERPTPGTLTSPLH